ncbi:hypothetical protein ABIC63_000506 [Pseudacidovorax sp. 1753]|uniref:hypothetical protein n=1 Tax=Pseudacidovorax sp. 1753 TaxID=3156419 RepID=UPI00339554CA
MSNDLLKTSTRVLRATQILLQPAVAGRAAYTSVETRTVCRWVATGGTVILNSDGTSNSSSPSSLSYTPGQYVCSEQQVLVQHAAVPASEAIYGTGYEYVVDPNVGWNAGGRSIAFIDGDGFVQFKVAASVSGVIAGLCSSPAPADYPGINIDHAFYLTRGTARVMEAGILKAVVGYYQSGTVFKIAREEGVVRYLIDESEVYVSPTPSSGVAWLEASLYAAGDRVQDPSIVAASLDTSDQNATFDISLPPLALILAEHLYAALSVVVPLQIQLASQPLQPSWASFNVQCPLSLFTAHALTGEVAQLALELRPLATLFADHPYAEAVLQLPALEVTLNAWEGNSRASMLSLGGAESRLTGTAVLAVIVNSAGHVWAAVQAHVLLDAAILGAATAGDSFAAQQVFEAVIRSYARSGAAITVPGDGDLVFVVNLDSGSTTEYTGYGFNSFARIGGVHYGARAGGLFALDGDTDDGLPIRAALGLGTLDFGNQQQKSVEACYLGVSSAGRLFLKVITGDGAYTYAARSSDPALRQQRVTPGKGLRFNYATFELYNEEGADFELDTVMFKVVDLARRI